MKCVDCGRDMEVYPGGFETTHLDENGNVDEYANLNHTAFCEEVESVEHGRFCAVRVILHTMSLWDRLVASPSAPEI